MDDFTGKVAIVTGASRGIGAALAQSLAQAGCHVVLAARSIDALDALATDLSQRYGVRTLALAVDMADAAAVHAMVEHTLAHFGGVDILINNAGMGLLGAIDQLDLADLREVFDVNFFGAVAALQAVAPVMRARGGGVIVNVSSIVGKFASPLGGGYSATKYALEAVSAAACAELARDNITVITLRPGLTDTTFAHHTRVSIPGSARKTGEHRPPARGVSAQRVAQRTLRAILRREREVYVTWYDRWLVAAACYLPGLFAWGLRLAVRLRRQRYES